MPFGEVIPPELVRVIVHSFDYRYPFKRGDEESNQIVSALHNNLFVEAIRQQTSNEEKEFSVLIEDGKGFCTLYLLHSVWLLHYSCIQFSLL